jgi:hypothetical protein
MQEGGSSSSSDPVAVITGVSAVPPRGVPLPIGTYLSAGNPAEVDIEEQAAAVAKLKVRPALPTPQEVAEHEATHTPYRSWCRHCVAGSGRREAHVSVSEASRDENCVTVSCDYC